MKKILVTGVGGGVGQSVIKALAGSPYEVVGVDSEELAAGLYAVPTAYKGLYASDVGFIDRLLEICRNEQCGFIFPGHDIELLSLARNHERFRAEGVIPMVSTEEILRISDDKLATQEFLKEHGYPSIETKQFSMDIEFEKPVILKPQWGGARSKGTYLARTAEEFNTFRGMVDPENCVVQEYIEGEEYTCGSVTFDGTCFGAIVMRRILRDGDTYKAFVEHPSPLEHDIRDIAESLNAYGACNIQFREKNGKPYVFEINARFSGTTASRALAGFNEPRMVADYLCEKKIPEYNIQSVSILRYWNELVVPNNRIDEIRNKGVLKGGCTQL